MPTFLGSSLIAKVNLQLHELYYMNVQARIADIEAAKILLLSGNVFSIIVVLNNSLFLRY